jgi:hypothetical protein
MKPRTSSKILLTSSDFQRMTMTSKARNQHFKIMIQMKKIMISINNLKKSNWDWTIEMKWFSFIKIYCRRKTKRRKKVSLWRKLTCRWMIRISKKMMGGMISKDRVSLKGGMIPKSFKLKIYWTPSLKVLNCKNLFKICIA